MKRLLFVLALALTFFVGTATAGGYVPADTRSPEQIAADNTTLTNTLDKLSNQQKLELLTAAQNVRNGLPVEGQAVASSANKAKEWVGVGSAIGDGLVATAGKLGVEVNKFAVSPVGKLAMVLILWNYMGEEVSGWIAGGIWLVCTLSFWAYFGRKFFGIYDEKGKFIKFDKEIWADTSKYSAIPVVFIIGLALSLFAGIVFLA